MNILNNGSLIRADSRMVRQINLHSVFTLIRQHKYLRISDIAHRTGLSVATVKYLVEQLTELRLITSFGEGHSTGGRKPVIYSLNRQECNLWSIEIQIDRLIGTIVDTDGNIRWTTERPIAAAVPDDIVDLTESIYRTGMRKMEIAPESVLGMAVTIPGFVDLSEKTIVLDVILGLEAFNLGSLLTERLGIPVFLLEEANAKLLAEVEYGIGKDHDNLLFLIIGAGLGKGIGAGFVTNGSIAKGSQGFLGEAGHMTLDPSGPLCTCGRSGCWEATASLDIFVHRAEDRCEELASLAYRDKLRRCTEFVALRDDRILPLFDWFVGVQAEGIANLLHLLDPELVVIGGEIAIFGEAFMGLLRSKLEQVVMKPFQSGYSLEFSPLGERGTFLGGSALLMQRAISIRQTA